MQQIISINPILSRLLPLLDDPSWHAIRQVDKAWKIIADTYGVPPRVYQQLTRPTLFVLGRNDDSTLRTKIKMLANGSICVAYEVLRGSYPLQRNMMFSKGYGEFRNFLPPSKNHKYLSSDNRSILVAHISRSNRCDRITQLALQNYKVERSFALPPGELEGAFKVSNKELVIVQDRRAVLCKELETGELQSVQECCQLVDVGVAWPWFEKVTYSGDWIFYGARPSPYLPQYHVRPNGAPLICYNFRTHQRVVKTAFAFFTSRKASHLYVEHVAKNGLRTLSVFDTTAKTLDEAIWTRSLKALERLVLANSRWVVLAERVSEKRRNELLSSKLLSGGAKWDTSKKRGTERWIALNAENGTFVKRYNCHIYRRCQKKLFGDILIWTRPQERHTEIFAAKIEEGCQTRPLFRWEIAIPYWRDMSISLAHALRPDGKRDYVDLFLTHVREAENGRYEHVIQQFDIRGYFSAYRKNEAPVAVQPPSRWSFLTRLFYL